VNMVPPLPTLFLPTFFIIAIIIQSVHGHEPAEP
jgi:hypothetical protein